MPYEPFHERFGELAWNETRSLTIYDNPRLAGDEFGLIEMYCNDENCDCRRVFFDVISRLRRKSVAVIAYGWESEAFYVKWYGSNDLDIIHELQGPALNLSSPQSELAPALLETVRLVLLNDPAYIARLQRHYQLFKERVDPKHFGPTDGQESKDRPVSTSGKRVRSRRK